MKILASDLDGTLYFRDENNIGYIKPEDAKAIKEFQAQGNLFGICSGRTLAGIHNAIDGLDVKLDFYILVSGAMLADKNENYIYRNTLSKEIVEKVVELTVPKGLAPTFCHENVYYRMFEKEQDPNPFHKNIQSMDELNHQEYDALHIAFGDMQTLNETRDLLNKTLGDVIEIHHNVLNLDITPKGCSKGIAIQTLNQYMDVKYEDIYVIGDSYNDISMFEAAKHAFTFHSSDEVVKEKADYFVENIAEAIKEIMK